jgi:glutaredoxin
VKTVRVFGASWCVNCKVLTQQLDQKKIEYKYIDVDTDIQMVKAYGIRSLPTTVVSDEDSYEIITGVDVTDILKVME